MTTPHLASRLLGLAAASAAIPGSASAQQPIGIGASISLTGAYATPGVYGRSGAVLCRPRRPEATRSWDTR